MHTSSPAALALIVATAPCASAKPLHGKFRPARHRTACSGSGDLGMPAVNFELMLQFAMATRRGAKSRSVLLTLK
jgi:hypothetical protein